MKAQQIYTQDIIIAPKIDEPVIAATAYKFSKEKSNRLVITGVIVIHLLILAMIITRTTQYKPLNIINPSNSKSVEVTMVEDDTPAPIAESASDTPAPPILATDQDAPELVHSSPAAPEQQPEVKLKSPPKIVTKPKDKTPVKPHTVVKSLTVHKVIPSQAKAHTIDNAKTAEKTALPATTSGPMLKSAPQADPKSVSTVGCEVPAPDYPRRARRLQEEGQVLVRLVIAANGTLSNSTIARSSGFDDLDQSALAAVSRAHCQPYIENGQAISVMTIQPVNFKISD